MLPTASGAPTVPVGVAGSVSHKGPLAFALAARIDRGGIGVDVECISARDVVLEKKVLTPLERTRLGERSDHDAAQYVLAHFSVKEAIYKALAAEEQEDLEFDDIELDLQTLPEQVWLTLEVRLLTRTSVVRAAILLDGDWMISASARTG